MNNILSFILNIDSFRIQNSVFEFQGSLFFSIIAAVIIIGLLYYLFTKGAIGLNQKEKITLLTLRLLFTVLIFFIISEPVLKTPLTLKVKPYLAVVIDDTLSLSKNKFSDEIYNAVENKINKSLKNFYKILLFKSSDGMTVPAESLKSINFRGSSTDITESILNINSHLKGEPAAGIIFISDGLDNSGDDPKVKLSREFSKNFPFFTAGIGYKNQQPEAEIRNVIYSKICAINTPHEIEAVIETANCAGKKIKLITNIDGKNIKEEIIDIANSQEEFRRKIKIPIEKLGLIQCSLKITADFQDFNEANNEYKFILKSVKDDKIDVLFFSGKVDWEYKFLKETLEDNERFTMTSILRITDNNNYVYSDMPERIELKKFPEELDVIKKFDIIILNEVKTDFLSQRALTNIIKAVEQGKGLIFFSGKTTFSGAGYSGSEIEKILPVYLNKADEKYIDEKFNIKLTPEARLFPPFKQLIDRIENLPAIKGYTRLYKLKAGAVSLLAHKYLYNEFGPLTIIALQKYGKGATLACASNSFWQWDIKTELNDHIYNDFWAGLIRNMTPKEEKTILAETKKYRYLADEKIEFFALNQFNMQGKMKYSITNAKNEVIQAGAVIGDKIDTALTQEGLYSFNITIEDSYQILDRDICQIEINNSSLEAAGKQMDEQTLKIIADISGGDYAPIDKIEKLFSKIPKVVKSDELNEIILLWNNPFFYIILILCVTAEWALRRKWGLL